MCVGYLEDGKIPVALDETAKERFTETSRKLGLRGLRGNFTNKLSLSAIIFLPFSYVLISY